MLYAVSSEVKTLPLLGQSMWKGNTMCQPLDGIVAPSTSTYRLALRGYLSIEDMLLFSLSDAEFV